MRTQKLGQHAMVSLLLLGALLQGCHAQEPKANIMPNAATTAPSAIHTPAQDNSASLVTGLPDFTRLVEFIAPAVVNIRVSEKVQAQRQMDLRNHPICQVFPDVPACQAQSAPRSSEAPSERVAGQGSGFITSDDGYILTNHHVIDGASSIVVVMPDKKEFKAKLIGSDARTDVAVLKIDGQHLPYLKMANSDKLRVGEWVMAAGSPFGLKNTVTTGIVSAINRDTGDYISFIQTDAAVNQGNSGGPLVNMAGEVVGINSQILSPSGAFSGIALSIPINDALQVAQQLQSRGKVERGRIGVGIEPIDTAAAKKLGLDKAQGVAIMQVEPNSPAARAGLEIGDVVLRVNDTAIEGARDFVRVIGESKVGSQLNVQIVRMGKAKTLSVVVGESKAS